MKGVYCLGSPPHTRGKESIIVSVNSGFRITPAYTGKSIYEDYFMLNI